MRSLARPARSVGFIRLGLLATAATVIASPALAQDVAVTATSAPEDAACGQPDIPSADAAVEEQAAASDIVSTGRRPIAESEAAALRVQKNSDGLVSVLSSDAVGRLPDQNIA